MKKKILSLGHGYFYNIKLKQKFIISHILVVLIPSFVIAILLYNQLSSIMLSNTIKSEQNLAKQTAGNIENTIDSVKEITDQLATDAYLKRILHLTPENLSENLNSNEYFISETANYLNTIHSTIDFDKITAVKIYMDDYYSTYYENPLVSSKNIFQGTQPIEGSYWYGIFSSTSVQTLICPSLYLTPSEEQNYGELAYIRKLAIFHDGRELTAYVAVYFNKENIDSILRKNMSIADSSSILLNEREALISSSNYALSGKYLIYYNDVLENLNNTNNFKLVSFGRERVYMAYNQIADTDWIMVSLVPSTGVIEESSFIVWQFFISYLLVVLLALFLSLTLSGSIVKRISSVVEQMKQVKFGKPQHLYLKAGKDEVGDLVDTYNYMVDEMVTLLDKQTEDADALRQAEFRALQSQINPHFLYNTLDMINWLSKSGKAEEVSSAVQALSKFYKFTLSKGSPSVTVSEELTHVSLYIKLQNMRYNNKIHFLIDIPDELLEYEMPKLVFQPIVENAIQHGILGKDSKEGNIVLTGWLDGSDIVFIISDNGIGIPEEKLPFILSGTQENKTGNNIGIYNTHKRLQLYYSNQYGLTYRSIENVETEVEIRIPARMATPEIL